MDGEQKESRCLICGNAYFTGNGKRYDASKHAPVYGGYLGRHIYLCHAGGDAACFCGWDGLDDNVQYHLAEHGGLEAHYMDFLMGVSKENQ